MSEKYFDSEGNEVKGLLTPEEIEEKLEEARVKSEEDTSKQLEEYQKETDEEIENMKNELEETRNELEKEKVKDKNFGNLRRSKDISNGKIEELEKKIEGLSKDIETGKTEASDQMVVSAIKSKAGDDKTLEESIRFFFNQFSKPKDTNELKQRVDSAYILATGGQTVNPLTGEAISGAGGTEPPMSEGTGKGHKLSPAGIEQGNAAGITDADREKAKKRGIIK